jgi:zinc protease
MFYKANEKYPSQEQFMERIRELGISFNGYTTEEFVTYFFTLPSKNLEDGMSFMSAAIMTPKFDEKELEREREVVLGEFDRDEAQPTFKLEYALDSAEWGNNVVRKQALGQRPTIKAATQEQMQTIQHRFYIPNNCALVVSGDVDANKVFALAEKYLSSWKRGDDPFPKYNPPPFQPMETKLVEREAALPDVVVEQRYWGPSVHWGADAHDDKGVYEADLLTTILSNETSNFHHVLVDSGIALSASAGYNMQHNVGPLEFDMELKPENTKKAISLLHNELKKMTSPDYYTEDELAAAKQSTATNRLYNLENPMSFAIGTTASWWGIAGIPFYVHYLDNIKKITRQDLADFAKKYLSQPYALGVGANAETLKQLALDPKEVLQ